MAKLRRTRSKSLWLVFAVLVIAFYATFFYIMSRTHNNAAYKKRMLYNAQVRPRKIIALVSQPRSGSTFLGQIFNARFSNILYLYEPLSGLFDKAQLKQPMDHSEEGRRRYDSTAIEFIKQIFNCAYKDDSNMILTRFIFSHFKFNSKALTRLCSQNSEESLKGCNNKPSRLMMEGCKKHDVIFVKFIEERLPQPSLNSLFRIIDELQSEASILHELQVIYLIRDPRASFWSLLHMPWFFSSQYKDPHFEPYVRHRCEEMNRSLDFISQEVGKNEPRVNFVRYEDVLENPFIAVKDLIDFLKLDTTHLRIPINTCAKCGSNNPLFNGSCPMKWKQYWRVSASLNFVQLIQSYCSNVLLKTGYRIYKYNDSQSQSSIRNCNLTVLVE